MREMWRRVAHPDGARHGPSWKARSTSALATYSTVWNPMSYVAAASRRSRRSRGIGCPAASRAKSSRTSGTSSQCS
jgi:hypothetical protein